MKAQPYRSLHRRRVAGIVAGLLCAAGCGPAFAGSFDIGNSLEAQYTLTLGYALGLRTERPSDALINGPISPVTNLPTTVNNDDGDRNFKAGSLINNRVSALGELVVSGTSYGVVLRGDAFYDNVYHRRNDNDSPGTVNKSGANDAFTDGARKYNGARVRMLDAYVYGDANLGSMRLNARLGRQVVAWGESLFFSGVASAQGPADATKVNIAGVEVKNILLPVEQLALQFGITEDLSLMGYYRLRYKATELEPAGSYYSTFDGIGPGAEFIYGFANPVYGVVPGATRTVNIQRLNDLTPSNHGQYGIGLQYQATASTNVGVYWLRYHDTNPAVQLNFGYAQLAPGVTTAPNAAPVTYNVRYYDGIHMAGASFSTKLGGANVAGEVSYRSGLDMLVNSAAGPVAARGRLSQALLSTIYAMSPNAVSQEIDLIAETGYVHVNGIAGGVSHLYNDRSSWGVSTMAVLNYRNLFSRWDLAVPVTYAAIINGTPAMAGSFGTLYGEHDQRASIFANFTYLQNLQLGVGYNAFLGAADLAKRPYADRDNVAINVKYSF